MPSIHETVKPTPAPRCPNPEHGKHFAGCRDCRRRSVYLRHLAIWEHANNIDHSYVAASEVREHIKFLTEEGHRTVIEIADESGVTDRTIFQITSGRRTKLFPLTARSLLAIQPAPAGNPPKRTLVPPLEGVRLLQGLFAQGWTGQYVGDQLGGFSRSAAQALAKGDRPWMESRTRDKIRTVADRIGHLDIAHLPHPLPGMDVRTAKAAAANGWRKLSHWRSWDITATDQVPLLAPDNLNPGPDPLADLTTDDPDDPDDLIDVEVAFIDPLIIKQVAETATRIRLGYLDDMGRLGGLWIPPLEHLHQLELHAAWWYANAAGLNETHIGALLGYDMRVDGSRSFEAGKRQALRVRGRVVKARAWFVQHRHGETPDWFTKRDGRSNIENLLPALIAVQPAPFGAGWTAEQLADACGVTTTKMAKFLTLATRKGDMPWSRQQHVSTRVARRPQTRCTTTVHATAA